MNQWTHAVILLIFCFWCDMTLLEKYGRVFVCRQVWSHKCMTTKFCNSALNYHNTHHLISKTFLLFVPWCLFSVPGHWWMMMMMIMILNDQMEVSNFVCYDSKTMAHYLSDQKLFCCSFIQILMFCLPFLLRTISHQFSSPGGLGLSGWTETRSTPDFTAHGAPKQHGRRTIWPGSER